PQGRVYLYEEGMDTFLSSNYLEVDTSLDTMTMPLPANLEESWWRAGLFLFFNALGEDGFLLNIHPDDPVEEMARISVSFHPACFNLSQETWDFIKEDPDTNTFITLNIMNRLLGQGLGAFLNATAVDLKILTGGQVVRYEKPEMAAYLRQLYQEVLPFPFNLTISEARFKTYFSQLLYQVRYVNGQQVTFTELIKYLLQSQNWSGYPFQISLKTTQPYLGLITNVVAASGRNYLLGNLAAGGRIYAGSLGGSTQTGYRLMSFPAELGGRELIRTYLEDAGSAEEEFLTFKVTRPVNLYLALDINHPDPQRFVNQGWQLTDWTITAARPPAYTDQAHFRLYRMDLTQELAYPVTVTLPGNGAADSKMYFLLADAGTYPFGIDMIVTAHAALTEDRPENVPLFQPGTSGEGGIVVNENGITTDAETGWPLVHVNLVQEFDANVFVNTEGGETAQLSVETLTDSQLVDHIIKNNGFRLIDTYNDQYPAFGAPSQVLSVENFLGLEIQPVRIELPQEGLATFTNMNLLNSPNLCAVHLKSIATDADLQLWLDEENNRGLNYQGIMAALKNALSYTYYLGSPQNHVTRTQFLKQLGRSAEGELTLGVSVELPEDKHLNLVASFFRQNYFTDVYDPVIANFLIQP
ncbi:MAG TPA: hypothetical protein PKW42_07445, partial [bacterium]|nr:hypothetical protein [bacterium]